MEGKQEGLLRRPQGDPIVAFLCLKGACGKDGERHLQRCVVTGQGGNGFKLKRAGLDQILG